MDGEAGSFLVLKIGTSLIEAEQLVIEATVNAYPTRAAAAKALGVCDKTLYSKLKQYREWAAEAEKAKWQATAASTNSSI